MSQQIDTSTGTVTAAKFRFQPPPDYDVIMYNDDVTSMDFVVAVLCSVFEYSEGKAVKVMLEIHRSVCKVVGTYPKSVAEYKLSQVEDMKKLFGFKNFRVEIRAREEGNGAV